LDLSDFVSSFHREILDGYSVRLSVALEELLRSKHLYQSAELDLKPLYDSLDAKHSGEPRIDVEIVDGQEECIDLDSAEKAEFDRLIDTFDQSRWVIVGPEQWERQHEVAKARQAKGAGRARAYDVPACKLPRFNRACPQCRNSLAPHKPGTDNGNPRTVIQETAGKSVRGHPTQHWFLTYQCQACDNEPLILMIRREGRRLTLTGRNLFEAVDIPKSIPDSLRKYYRECLIAKIAGKGLPAALFLRVLIERHMRAAIGLNHRLRGDELAEKYSKVLDSEFPSSARSFRETYDNLSVLLHEGEENSEVLEAALVFVIRHFELLKLIPMPEAKSDAISAATIGPDA